MRIVPSESEYNCSVLVLSSGESVSETSLVNTLLANSNSFANRPKVEAEVRMIFNLLADAVNFTTKKKNEEANLLGLA